MGPMDLDQINLWGTVWEVVSGPQRAIPYPLDKTPRLLKVSAR